MPDHTNDESAPLGETPAPKRRDEAQSSGSAGAATGLQPGGTIPGGGPGAIVGSLGTGGGSNADQPTGDADENQIEEQVK
jgi:hypothetical protein